MQEETTCKVYHDFPHPWLEHMEYRGPLLWQLLLGIALDRSGLSPRLDVCESRGEFEEQSFVDDYDLKSVDRRGLQDCM